VEDSKSAKKGSDSGGRDSSKLHPSRSLEVRSTGYGIGGGYERRYRGRTAPADAQDEPYGPVPHSGYYGAGTGLERFKRGQAGYGNELPWFIQQYGQKTSGQDDAET
jgi:hypothetical protein